jgi:glucose-1-phosphate thymidylyltransferase
MKAIVLAAGEGQRLAPLTNRRPKPMLPIANRPLIGYVIQALAEGGIDEIVLVVGYKRDRIQTYVGDGDDWGVDVEYVLQDTQLGTGHALLQAEDTVDGRFVVCNGDRIIEPTAVEAVLGPEETAPDAETAATVTVTRSSHPERYGVVTVEDGQVTRIVEKPHAEESGSALINAGVYGFGPSIFDAIRDTPADGRGEVPITGAIERLIDGQGVRATRYRGQWLDVSQLWDVLHVTARAIESGRGTNVGEHRPEDRVADSVCLGEDVDIAPGAVVSRSTALADNVRVGANAVIENCVVMADARIGHGAVLRDCIVAENATVAANATVAGGDATVAVEGSVYDDVRLGGVVGDNARIGGGSVLDPGTIVGDEATVAGGLSIDGRVAPGVEVRRG